MGPGFYLCAHVAASMLAFVFRCCLSHVYCNVLSLARLLRWIISGMPVAVFYLRYLSCSVLCLACALQCVLHFCCRVSSLAFLLWHAISSMLSICCCVIFSISFSAHFLKLYLCLQCQFALACCLLHLLMTIVY